MAPTLPVQYRFIQTANSTDLAILVTATKDTFNQPENNDQSNERDTYDRAESTDSFHILESEQVKRPSKE
jgi:hypothetical protein